jgi:hypothetical protein
MCEAARGQDRQDEGSPEGRVRKTDGQHVGPHPTAGENEAKRVGKPQRAQDKEEHARHHPHVEPGDGQEVGGSGPGKGVPEPGIQSILPGPDQGRGQGTGPGEEFRKAGLHPPPQKHDGVPGATSPLGVRRRGDGPGAAGGSPLDQDPQRVHPEVSGPQRRFGSRAQTSAPRSMSGQERPGRHLTFPLSPDHQPQPLPTPTGAGLRGPELAPPLHHGSHEAALHGNGLPLPQVETAVSGLGPCPHMGEKGSRQEAEKEGLRAEAGALGCSVEKEEGRKEEERPGEGDAQVEECGPGARCQGQPHHRRGPGYPEHPLIPAAAPGRTGPAGSDRSTFSPPGTPEPDAPVGSAGP